MGGDYCNDGDAWASRRSCVSPCDGKSASSGEVEEVQLPWQRWPTRPSAATAGIHKKIPFYDVLYSLVVTFLLSHHLTMILIISTMAVFYIIFMVRVGNQGAI